MPYLVLEYLQGESLAQRLQKGPMPVDAVFPIIRQVGSALAAAHAKGIVHRDLKPQNIFLVPSEIDGRTMEIAKVLDFGISKMRDSSTVKTQDSALLGTPQYMAPEQALGKHDEVDPRSDIFALGSIVYEMLCGQPAFSGQTIPEVVFKVVYEPQIPLETRVPALSGQVLSAVQRALAKKADDRFDSITAFLEALTGAPVSLIRNPPSLPPVGADGVATETVRAPDTGREAFAQTMDSGNHGASPLTRTPPAALPTVDGDAPTIASQDGTAPAPNLGIANTLGAVASLAAAPSPTSTDSKRPLVVAGSVLAAAIAAAAIMYAVMRRPPAPPSHGPVAAIGSESTPNAVTPLPPDAPRIEQEILVAPTGSDGSASSGGLADRPDAGTDPAQKADPKPRSRPPEPVSPASDPDPGSADTHAGKKLRESYAALADHRWREAGTAATLVTTAERATPKQLAQAQMILGIVACHSNDEEGAAAALRKVPRNQTLRARILAVCHKLDYLTTVKR
jgi:serine/threonine-protein kinase